MQRIMFAVAVAAAVGACALEDARAQVESAGSGVQSAGAQDVARAALRLYEELAARLEERGHTPDELLVAGEAGDEQRVRAMLGYSDAEFEAVHTRLVAIVTAAACTPADVAYPDGWTCQAELLPCITSIGLAYIVRGASVSVPALLAYGGIHVAGCVYAFCSFDRTDPGPPVGRP
jgi:hypothetical protein